MKPVTFLKIFTLFVLAAILLAGELPSNPFRSYVTCSQRKTVAAGEFERPYLPSNSGLSAKFVRSVAAAPNGMWFGHGEGVGVTFMSKSTWTQWSFCGYEYTVNSILVDEQGRVWVGMDSQISTHGLLMFDGHLWYDFTVFLPDSRVYDLVMHEGILYASTWEGVAAYDGTEWSIAFSQMYNIFNNHNHAILFDRQGGAWFGGIDGLSTRMLPNTMWRPLATKEMGTATAELVLSTDKIRDIAEHPTLPEVWIVGDGGDAVIYNYAADEWRWIAVPNSEVFDIEFDQLERAWVATSAGTFYLEQEVWRMLPYEYPALAIAFGCEGCKFGKDAVFVGTNDFGVIYTRLPAILLPKSSIAQR